MPEAKEIIHNIAEYLSLVLDTIAILMVAIGAAVALTEILRVPLKKQVSGRELRNIFINFARWLVAALTFQLGSDIIETSFSPSWDELGRLASIAFIRTFLTYFLDRDLEKAREEQHAEVRIPISEKSGKNAPRASGSEIA